MTSSRSDGSTSSEDILSASRPLYRTTWHYEEELGTAIVAAVAEIPGENPSDLDPLHEHVDVDALSTVFDSVRNGAFTFDYTGYEIEVRSTGVLMVCAPDD